MVQHFQKLGHQMIVKVPFPEIPEMLWGRARAQNGIDSISRVHLSRTLEVSQTTSLTLMQKLQDEQIGHFMESLGLCFSLLSVQYQGSSSWPITVSPFVTVPWDPGIQTFLATRARWSRVAFWVAATESGMADNSKSFSVEEIDILEYNRWREPNEHLLS